MRSMWKRKWVVIPVAATIILVAGAAGAVALADPGSDSSAAALAQSITTTTVQSGGDAAGVTPAVEELGNRRAKLQHRLDQIKKRWADARAKMTPEDQAAFDQLQDKAKTQQEELRQARKDLAETLKQMRALVKKYHPATTTTSAPTN